MAGTVAAEGTHPKLTSVDMNLEGLGRLAARRLFEAIDGATHGSGLEYQPCRLAVRGSTNPEI